MQPQYDYQASATSDRSDPLKIHTVNGHIPIYNTKSTIVPCLDTDYIFLFGGFDELDSLDSNVYLLNLKTMNWEIDDKHNGLYREGHLAVYIGQGNVLVYGGIPHDEFPEAAQNDPAYDDSTFRKDSIMMIYNIFDRKWVGPPRFALNNSPSSRYRHACCLSPDSTKVYISGGLVDSMPLDDLYCYDLISGVWLGPIKFVSRFDHSIRIYNGKLFTFGGLDKDMNHVMDCMTYLCLNDQSVNQVSLLLKPVNKSFEDTNNLEAINEYPYPRSRGSEFERIYINSKARSSLELEISIPLIALLNEYSISYYDMENFKHTLLINQQNIDFILKQLTKTDANYLWKHAFVTSSGSLFLLGTEHEWNISHNDSEHAIDNNNEYNDDVMATQSEGDDELAQEQENEQEESVKLHCLLEVSLSNLGFFTRNIKPLVDEHSLATDFKQFLLNQKFTDFEIITFCNESIMEEYNKNPEDYNNIIDSAMTDDVTSVHGNLKILKVHKPILLARWNHFRRLIGSGMNETISNKMFIPEPHKWVQGVIFYLYTGSIELDEFETLAYTLLDYSGMLILSNLYEIIQLRIELLHYLYLKLNDYVIDTLSDNISRRADVLIKVWTNALVSNEEILVAKVVEVIRDNWLTIIRTNAFMNLPKNLIIKLCQNCVDFSKDDQIDSDTESNSPIIKLPNVSTNISSDRDSLDSNDRLPSVANSNAGTPTNMRGVYSDSPFLKITNEISSPTRTLSNNAAHFPALQILSNVLNDKIED